MPDKKRSLCIVLHAGKMDESALNADVEALRERGHRVTVRLSAEAGEARRLAAEAARHGIDVVVAAGGDGTLNEVVTGLCQGDAPMPCAVAVLPLGTANDFATACEIHPNDVPAALNLAAEAAVTPIDLGRVNGRVFVNAASGGFGAEVTAGTPDGLKTVLGGFAYLVNGLATATDVMRYQARFRAPEFEWEGSLVAFSVANGRLAGGGFSIAPEALLNDGLLDVVLIPELSLGVLADVIGGALNPSPDGLYEHLVTCRVPWFELTVSESMPVNLDGETIRDDVFRFDVLRGHALFCLPPTAPLAH